MVSVTPPGSRLLESAASGEALGGARPAVVRVCLMVRTHALPPLSYLVPAGMSSGVVGVGSVVVAPLSGRGRMGVVVGLDDEAGRAREYLRSVADFSLTPEVVELCGRVAEETSSSLASMLGCALPPGISTGRYEVVSRREGWKWEEGATVARQSLKRTLGEEGFKRAESGGDIVLRLSLRQPAAEEVAMPESGVTDGVLGHDLSRAPLQRRVMERLLLGGVVPTSELLSGDGFKRETLRALVRRGLARLEKRHSAGAITVAGGAAPDGPEPKPGTPDLSDGGVFVRRVPTKMMHRETVASGRVVLRSGGSFMVLVPEVSGVEEVAGRLASSFPEGTRIGVYHSGIGDERGEVWRAASEGGLDVLVGTRSAAMIPLRGLGGACVVDEPNPSHRAGPGHEGVPTHAREVMTERSRIEGCGVLFLSPHPSLRLHAATLSGRVGELPPVDHDGWPRIRLVDMRGTGAYLSRTLLETCREALERGGKVGVLVDRTGRSASVVCSGCGGTRTCTSCGASLTASSHKGGCGVEPGACPRCGEGGGEACASCGSLRTTVASGMTVEGLAARLSEKVGVKVGTLTADRSEDEDVPFVVGTPARLLARSWDVVAVPDADAVLYGGRTGASERAFRVLFDAAEASVRSLVVQTRNPENATLRAAVRGDYLAFASEELPRLQSLGYPPFGHTARIAVRGTESEARRAVESGVSRAGVPGVKSSGIVAGNGPGDEEGWLVLLRSNERGAVASVATCIAAEAAKSPRRTRVTVEIDPEEI